MSCSHCNNNGPTSTTGMQVFYNPACATTSGLCPGDIAGYSYQGPNLPCTNIVSGTNMQDLLIAFDTALCATLGDYTLYNLFCLDDDDPIDNEQEFVEAISEFVCTLRSDFTAFTDTTFTTYQSEVDTRFDLIENPSITSCAEVGIINSDNYTTVLNKLSTAVCNIYNTELDLSAVTWAQCFSVSTPPTSIQEGFNLLLDQLCIVKGDVAAGATLPTYNNIGTCLPDPTSLDSLDSTIIKIRTRLCQSPTFDINALTWNCITKPTTVTTDLQSAFQALMTKVDALSANNVSFNGDFSVAYVNPAQPCLGKTVALATSSAADRYVAINVSDTTPGTLIDKLEAGTNTTFDTTTTPGKLIINTTGSGGASDGKVKAGSTDDESDYLIGKLDTEPNNYGISPVVIEDTSVDKVIISNEVNIELLTSKILEAIANDSTLLNQLCALNRQCPSPCAPPTNVQVTYVAGTTTSTTTTTTAP